MLKWIVLSLFFVQFLLPINAQATKKRSADSISDDSKRSRVCEDSDPEVAPTSYFSASKIKIVVGSDNDSPDLIYFILTGIYDELEIHLDSIENQVFDAFDPISKIYLQPLGFAIRTSFRIAASGDRVPQNQFFLQGRLLDQYPWIGENGKIKPEIESVIRRTKDLLL